MYSAVCSPRVLLSPCERNLSKGLARTQYPHDAGSANGPDDQTRAGDWHAVVAGSVLGGKWRSTSGRLRTRHWSTTTPYISQVDVVAVLPNSPVNNILPANSQ